MRVLVSYEVTRGITLVVGRVHDGFGGGWGCLRKFWVGLGGSRGVLLYPFKALYAPLKVSHSTRFGSRQYKMVQLANVNKVSITEPFLAGWSPFRGSQRAIL